MARKGKSKKADATANGGVTTTAAPVDNIDSSAAGDAEPVFSRDVVKKCQQKNQGGMQKVTIRGKNDKGQQLQRGKEQAKSRREGKREQGKSVTACQKNPAPNASIEPRGIKRSRDGQGRNSQQPTIKPTSANGSSKGMIKKSVPSKKSISDEDLLEEILELGGTKDDLDLVKDVGSDDDNEIIEGGSTAKGDKALRGDLKKLMVEMGHDLKTFASQQVVPDDELSEEDVEGEGSEKDGDDHGDEDDEQEEDEGNEEAGEQKANGTKVLETSSASTKYTSGKLVCYSTLFRRGLYANWTW